MAVEAVVFDFDGTLTVQRGGWHLLHELYGTKEAGAKRTEAYREGELTFAEWCRGNVDDWCAVGVTKDDIDRAARAVKPTTGADALLTWLDERGFPFGIISGGITDLQHRFEQYDPAFSLGNDLVFDDGELVDADPNVGPNAKDEVLAQACRNLGVDLDATVYVGDSHTDIEAFEVAGHAILFDPDDRLPERAYDLVDELVARRDLRHIQASIEALR